jgi:peptide/nickel transport system substrate-binding protein
VATIGAYSRDTGLDPAKLAGGGTVGGNELAAIYDTIMRYNDVNGKYEPRTAESLTPNTDFTVWTLKLKPNLKFTDGTAYDAAAVKFVGDREIKEGTGTIKGQMTTTVKTIEVVDALTVRYTLNKGWAGFPDLLAGPNGLIYSPTAFQKAGTAFNTAGSDAGAGPFKVKSYKSGEALELERNPNYWGGDVYLDGLKFVLVGGAPETYDALKTGTVTAGYMRDPLTVATAKAAKYPTIDMPQTAGNMVQMNAGVVVTCAAGAPANLCAGKPDGTKVPSKTVTSDVRIRRAVAMAIDLKTLNDRVWQGKADVNSAPFAGSPWDPKVDGPKYDLNAAKALVTQIKSETGWDGKIRVLAMNTAEGQTWSIAVGSMLQLAGMDPQVDNSKPTADMVSQVNVLRDYDLVFFGSSLSDEIDYNYLTLSSTFSEANPRFGYANPEMTAAVDQLRTADSDDKRVAAYKAISAIWTRDVPSLVVTSIAQALVLSPKFHGPYRTGLGIILFDKAWLEK